MTALALTLTLAQMPSVLDPAGPTKYGELRREGMAVWLAPHNGWSARGTVNHDGSVYLLWEHDGGIRQAHGHYRRQGDTLSGEWGYVENCVWDGTELIGCTLDDVLR